MKRMKSLKNRLLGMSRKKKVALIIAIIILFFVIRGATSGNKPQYTTTPVTRETIVDTVSETGNVAGQGRVDVYSPSTGIIQELFVQNDDVVKAGQSLFRVTSTATAEQKTSAYASYQAAASAHQQAQNNYKDAQATAQKVEDDVKGHDNDETYEQKARRTTAQVARDNAYEQLKITSSQLTSAQMAYQATQNALVKAQVAGQVFNLVHKIGGNVIATGVSGAEPVLVISDGQGMSLRIEINEVDRPKIKVGQKAQITLTAIKDKSFDGIVETVDSYGQDDDGVITYTVGIEVPSLDEVLPGMTANVEIETEKVENVLTVPNGAIKAYEGGKAVQIVGANGQLEFVPVKTGLKGSTRTQILSGVDEGVQVVVTPPKSQSSGFFGGQ